jgi:predicted RNA-binding protein associated with RNAse of E/G family
MPDTITEMKYSPGKKPETWDCEIIQIDAPTSARIRYVNDRQVETDGLVFPAGTVTEGVYWSDRPYHVWKMTAPDGELLGYRFDICTGTYIWPRKIIWTDLGYDLWVSADGEATWLDVNEVEQMARMEHMSYKEVAFADEGRAELDACWRDVLREAFNV